MGILAKDLKPNDEVVLSGCRVPGKVYMINGLKNGQIQVTFASGDSLVVNSDDNFQRTVKILVPTMKRFGMAAAGKTPYEVLVFYTEWEYDTTKSERDMKQRIVAKFRDYEAALEFAKQEAFKMMYAHVILRA